MDLDDVIPKFNVMGRTLKMQEPKKEKTHPCDQCPDKDRLEDGCENCVHEWSATPNSGQMCLTCRIRFP